MQGKTDLIERQKQQMQQAQQQQQQQMEIQMQEIQSRSKLSESMAYSQQASGNERNSRVEENRALAIEKIAESRKQEEEAFLNKIKIIKEIESLDIAHITELLSAINNLKEADQNDEDIKKEVNPLL
jgi:carboxylesterase type B